MDTSSERKMLQESVADLLTDRCAPETLQKAINKGNLDDLANGLSTALAELGLQGVLVPESSGGVGGTAEDVFVVAKELGRRLAPVPYLQNQTAIHFLLQLGAGDTHEDLLKSVTQGRSTLSFLLSPDTLEWAPSNELEKPYLIPFGDQVDHVLWAYHRQDHVIFTVVPLQGAGLESVETIDLTWPMHRVSFDEPPLAEGPEFKLGTEAFHTAMAKTRDFSMACLAHEMLGGAEACLDDIVTFVQEREQFGQPIGMFQAVQHKAAEMALLRQGSRAFCESLGAALEGDPAERTRLLQMAKAHLSDSYRTIAERSLHLYGGIGYTWEHTIHLYLRHANRCSALLGDPATLRTRHVKAMG